MAAYYNEIDSFAASWLRKLIKAGHIAPGDVDERDIRDVRPGDLASYTQCHFFAGIGVWSYALRRAGWPDDRPVWTGSCPCQSFSAAGKGAGFVDERHLWPAWYHLIGECRPDVIFGEQVEAAIRHSWLDLVQTDLEGIGYACGAYGLPAAGFGAPHIRSRLYFVAHTTGIRFEQRWGTASTTVQGQRPERSGEHARSEHTGKLQGRPEGLCGSSELGHPSPGGLGIDGGAPRDTGHSDEPERAEFMGDASSEGLEKQRGERRTSCETRGGSAGETLVGAGSPTNQDRTCFPKRKTRAEPGPANGFWSSAEWIACRDGKARPVEPGVAPLASIPAKGVGREQSKLLKLARSNRVGRLRGYGNSITAEVAVEFIRAYLNR